MEGTAPRWEPADAGAPAPHRREKLGYGAHSNKQPPNVPSGATSLLLKGWGGGHRPQPHPVMLRV